MRVILFIFLILSFVSCDTAPVRPDVGGCMEHSWIKGIYKILKTEGSQIKLKNVSGGEDRSISIFDRGWTEVKCP